MCADDPDAAADAAMQALTEAMVRVHATQLAELAHEKGVGSALAFAFAGVSVGAQHLALTMGAGYAIEYLDDVAKPLRDFLTEHGGPGTGTCQ